MAVASQQKTLFAKVAPFALPDAKRLVRDQTQQRHRQHRNIEPPCVMSGHVTCLRSDLMGVKRL